MAFIDGLNRMCKLNGTTPTALLRDLGLSTSKVTAWNNGSLPKESVMGQLANHLECRVCDFFSEECEVLPQDDDESEILSIFRKLNRKERHEFMTAAYEFEKKHNADIDNKDEM